MRLYASTRTVSLAARLALALSGLRAEIVLLGLRAGEHLTPDFAAINPKRQVPVLVLEDGTTITETAAVLLAFGEMAPASGLLPQRRPARWQVMEWLAWATFVHARDFLPALAPHRFGAGAAEGAVREAALARAEAALAFLAERLGARAWFVGDDVTLADCHLVVLTVFAGFAGVAPPDALLAHRARLFALPALAATLQEEGFAT